MCSHTVCPLTNEHSAAYRWETEHNSKKSITPLIQHGEDQTHLGQSVFQTTILKCALTSVRIVIICRGYIIIYITLIRCLLTLWAHRRTWPENCWPVRGRWPAVCADRRTVNWCEYERNPGAPMQPEPHWPAHRESQSLFIHIERLSGGSVPQPLTLDSFFSCWSLFFNFVCNQLPAYQSFCL